MSKTNETKATPVPIPNVFKFANGGLAGMGATMFVQPLDLIKTRMQLGGEGGAKKAYNNSFHAAQTIFKTEGLSGLYNGLSAGLLRQATYTTARMGIFSSAVDSINKTRNVEFLEKIGLGMIAGGTAAFVGTPAEVALIRMTSDGKLPKAEQRGYKNVFNALGRIVREEGAFTLWKGAMPTVARSMVVNGVQLSAYSQAKESLLKSSSFFTEGIMLHFCASMISGLATTVASMPVDIVKTRVQKSSGQTNAFQIFGSLVKNEGVLSLWKGFTPYYARLGPHTVLTFIFLEQLNTFYRKIAA